MFEVFVFELRAKRDKNCPQSINFVKFQSKRSSREVHKFVITNCMQNPFKSTRKLKNKQMKNQLILFVVQGKIIDCDAKSHKYLITIPCIFVCIPHLPPTPQRISHSKLKAFCIKDLLAIN